MRNILLLVTALYLTGCVATQKPIAMKENYLQSSSKKIGVIFTDLPKPDVHLPGAGCLLCIVVAEAANSELSDHVEKLQSEELKPVKEQLLTKLRGKGLKVMALSEKLDNLPDFDDVKEGVADKDYRSFAAKYGISHLMVIKINAVGMERKYSNYIPTSDPNATVQGVGYLVDLKDNSYKWYKHIKVLKGAVGNWDEPPAFPSLTNAYYQALESSKDVILNEF